jgi:hypothetical protein
VKAVGKAIVKGAKAVGRGLKKLGKKIVGSKAFKALAKTKVGKAIAKGWNKVRAKVKGWKEKIKEKYRKWKERRAERRKKAVQKRFDKGVQAVRRLIDSTKTEAGMRSFVFRARLAWIRLRYRFSALDLGSGVIHARMNPIEEIPNTAWLIELDKIEPAYPPGETALTVRRDFAQSRSGNRRLFAFKPKNEDTRRYLFRSTGENKGFWNGIRVNEDVKEAEEAARQRLESEKTNYVALVPPTKDPSAPGFDVAGIGQTKVGPGGIAGDRLTIGEAKTSSAKTGRWFSARDTTAITGNPLEKGIGKLLTQTDQSLRARVRTALVNGNVDFVVYLAKGAKFSELQRITLKVTIKRDLIEYLSGVRFKGLSRTQIARAVRNVTVTVQRI